MRDYGKVHTSFWSSSTVGSMSEDGRMLALYLLTSPHSNITGVFRLPDGYAMEDLNWVPERVAKGFAELFRKGFANRCETTKWVWISKHLEWNQPENPNQRKAAKKIALSIPDECGWKLDFMRVWGESLGISPEEFGNPSGTVPEPFLNQEQEQKQEQEQEQKKTNPPPPPVTGGSAGTLTEKKARVKSERMTLKTFLDRCRETGDRPIGGYDPLQKYIAEAKLPVEFVNLAWAEFKRDFGPGGKRERKQQALWRRHFLNFVEGNFYRLWYAKPQGDGIAYELTTVGLQAQMAMQAREAA
ncbi:hypothetical protein [Achromobacter marplatensis]|uniref:hypothetical protein n=1 Tax=Achromobacter marplatensis TaxID=470868 RepID=UPI0028E9A35D|nr:hypothetical protein [Achromobacter marplatensis]